MAVVFPGGAVLALMRSAASRVVIAAPYIKSETVQRLIEALPGTVSECICVTRWLPEDIVSRVCDLEIFDHVAQIRGGRLLVHPHLHAKYYSDGQKTLVGSANLTSRGLGWYTPSNVELLVELPAEFPGLLGWETALLDSAVEATEQLRDQIRAQAEQIERDRQVYRPSEVDEVTGEREEPALWIPKCPVPERLWEVYRGHGTDTMVSSAFDAARDDLAALSPPQGLSENLFMAYVAGILRQMPLLAEVDRLASTGLTDIRAQDFLHNHLSSAMEDMDDYARIWRIVKLWLVYFFPNSYRLEADHEILIKGREIS